MLINLFDAEIEIFQDKYVKTMAADALAPNSHGFDLAG